MRRARAAGVPVVTSCAGCQPGRRDLELFHSRTIVRQGSSVWLILVAEC